MKQNTPPSEMTLPITLQQYQQLCLAACRGGFAQEHWEIGATAIREWMARNNPDAFALPAHSGFQWKQLFLPDGTVLRTVFNGQNHHSHVEGDRLLHNGVATSPSRFANAPGGVRRNAWDVIWILFPDAQTWKRAADLRPKNRRRPKRVAATGQGALAAPTKRRLLSVVERQPGTTPAGRTERRGPARPAGN